MRVMLFGASGQVGTEIRRLAAGIGVELIIPSRDGADLSVAGQAAARIADTSKLDGVINAAAYTAVDLAETEREAAQRINADAPGEIATACHARSIPLIHFSTDFVFGPSAPRRPLKETDPTGPINVYGKTKLDGEHRVRESGAAPAIVRLSWVVSAHGRNFLKTMIRLGRERDRLRIVDDQFGRPTSASAAAEASLKAMQALANEPELAGLYHFTSTETTSWAGLAEAIFDAAGLSVEVERISTEEYPTPAERPAWSAMDPALFCETFHISPPDWRSDIRAIVNELHEEEKVLNS